LEYPGFREGLSRRIQIVDIHTHKTEGGPIGVFKVILKKDDYDDFIGKSGIDTI